LGKPTKVAKVVVVLQITKPGDGKLKPKFVIEQYLWYK
jgi:hypothetical protein